MRNNSLVRLCVVLLLGTTLSSPLRAAEPIAEEDIEEFLQGLVATFSPYRSGKHATATKFEAAGKTMRLTLEVDGDKPFFTNKVRYSHLQAHCDADGLNFPLINAGATVETLYVRPDGEELALITVDQKICEMPAMAVLLETQSVETLLRDFTPIVSPTNPNAPESLVSAQAEGKTLRYTYQVDTNVPFKLGVSRFELLEEFCSSEVVGPLIDTGATLEFLYIEPSGEELAIIVLNQEICETPAADVVLQSQSLESYLQELTEEEFPRQVNEKLTIVKAESTDTTLRYTVHVPPEGTIMLAPLRLHQTSTVCLSMLYGPLIKAGATIVFSYKQPEGKSLGSVTVDKPACEALPVAD
jgi:hypothetical protein